jgi:hypothetical protein
VIVETHVYDEGIIAQPLHDKIGFIPKPPQMCVSERLGPKIKGASMTECRAPSELAQRSSEVPSRSLQCGFRAVYTALAISAGAINGLH